METVDGRVLTQDELEANRRAVMALIDLSGGAVGFLTDGGRFSDLMKILRADPDDDLSGLRYLSTRKAPGSFPVAPSDEYEESLLDPEVARKWLIRTNRATEGQDGLLAPSEYDGDDVVDHLTLAGIAIANGDAPDYLSIAYSRLTNSLSPHPPELIAVMSRDIVGRYAEENQF